MNTAPALFFVVLTGCGSSYPADDEAANTIASRAEARVLDFCSADDAAACTPSKVRSFTRLAYCANARELASHGASVPEAGVACQAK
jgi:hypothetical protein